METVFLPEGHVVTLLKSFSRRDPRRTAARERSTVNAIASECLEDRVLLAAQVVTGTVDQTSYAPGDSITLALKYDAVDVANVAATGLSIRIHYDSSRLQFDRLVNPFETGFAGAQDDVETHSDGDPDTDRIVRVLWFTLADSWPGNVELPVALLSAQFTATQTRGDTTIRLTGNAPAGFEFRAEPVPVAIQSRLQLTVDDPLISEDAAKATTTATVTRPAGSSEPLTVTFRSDPSGQITFPTSVTIDRDQLSRTFPISAVDDDLRDGTQVVMLTGQADGFADGRLEIRVADNDRRLESLDIDDDGAASPLSDGIIIIRYLARFSGTALTKDAVNPRGLRSQSVDIEGYLASIIAVFDADNNQSFDALSDGIVIIRFLAGFTGVPLIDNVVDTVAGTRKTSDDVYDYLDQFRPAIPAATRAGSPPVVSRSAGGRPTTPLVGAIARSSAPVTPVARAATNSQADASPDLKSIESPATESASLFVFHSLDAVFSSVKDPEDSAFDQL